MKQSVKNENSKESPFANLKKPLMQNPNGADIYEEDGDRNQVDSLATHRYTIIAQ